MNTAERCLIIAEVGVNHNGSLDRALQLVDVAAETGADIVKFQTFSAGRLASSKARKVRYQSENTPGENETQLEMLRQLELSTAQHRTLREHCATRNIGFLSSCFDLESLNFLENGLNVSKHKLGSGELTNAPLLLEVARTKKPVIISTGMAHIGEIEQALGVLAFGYSECTDDKPGHESFRKSWQNADRRQVLSDMVTLLHCTTEYPAPIQSVNLRAMQTMRQTFGLMVGYSDHTKGATASIAAVALGARIIEKHLTLDQTLPGPDHSASMEPHDFKEMVTAIRHAEQALGHAVKVPGEQECENMREVRKSLVAATNIKAGELFSEHNIAVKRPGYGRSPHEYWSLLGQEASRDYEVDELI